MKQLLDKIKSQNILLEVVEGELELFATEAPDPALLDEIRAKKEELVRFLSGKDQAYSNESFASGIPAVPQAESYPLSASQRMLWVVSQLEEANVGYNNPGAYIFEGSLDFDALAASFDALIERHENLRTVFREDEKGEVRQYVRPAQASGFRLAYHDLQDREDRNERVRVLARQQALSAFDLAEGPLLRATIFQLEKNKWVFSYVMHHIISDGWSMDILIRELLQLYNARIAGAENPLTPLRIQYKDYTAWQLEQLGGGSVKGHREWWLKQLEGELPVLELWGGKPRPAMKTYNGAIIRGSIGAEAAEGLKSVCRAQGATLFMGLVAAVNALLHRYTGQEDIIIGSPIAGRQHADLEDQIGFYVNTLALRARFTGRNSYRELLDEVKQFTLGAYEHQVLPFAELVEALQLQRDMSRNPLFDVQVILGHAEGQGGGEAQSLGKLEVSPYREEQQLTSRFDIVFSFMEYEEGFLLQVRYNPDVYTQSMMTRLGGHLDRMMNAIAASPDTPIGELDFLAAEEKQQLLAGFNDTAKDFPQGKTLVSLFEEHAEKNPDHPAVVFGKETLTYGELNEKATQLAAYLRSNHNIGADDLVGIMLDRSEKMIIALMAVLKAGAAYVPIDSDYPRPRKEFIINDTALRLLITQTDYLFDLDFYSGDVFAIDVQMDMLEEAAGTPGANVLPEHLAYVIYTSGSTGQPKGVMIEHRAIMNTVYAQQAIFGNGGEDRCLQFASTSFDASVWETFMALGSGAALYVVNEQEKKDPSLLEQYIRDNGITIATLPPAFVKQMRMDRIKGMKRLITAGEAAIAEDALAFARHGAYYNAYGPTESSICATVFKVEKEGEFVSGNVPIGAPLPNTQLYILDADRKPVPAGVTGEICIGGAGLARGYLNRPELTAEKFISNPFVPGERLYRTGDLGRWLDDGNIEFIGRKDEQVKIRGFRIELGEIETVLQGLPGMEAAVAAAPQNAAGEKELVAYIVSATPIDTVALRNHLSSILPPYMVPSHFVQMERMPLTHSGKIDRKALPHPKGLSAKAGVEYMAPRNSLEEQLVQLWQEVLGQEKISVKDNFFDLGGHSLKATRLGAHVHRLFDVRMTLNELFAYPVLEEQAQYIAQAAKDSFAGIEPVEIRDDYALSSAQGRLWVLSQFEEANKAHNMPGVCVFEGSLHRASLEAAFALLIERHESLRTVFRENGHEIRQLIHPAEASGFRLNYLDLRNDTDREGTVRKLVHDDFTRPFDLSSGPLLRAGLYQVAESKWVFSYVLHHIIGDGWSMNLLIKELLQFYHAHANGKDLAPEPLRIQYKDYAAWEQEQLGGENLQAHRDYWLKQFEGELPMLQLPGDKPRPATKTYNGKSNHLRLNAELAKGLKALAQQGGGSLFMSLLASVNALLHRYTGQEDIIIGSPIAGREHADLQGQIGFYLNTIAFRSRFSGSDSFLQLLDRVKGVTLDAYEHQVYPFDELVEALNLRRDRSRSALFDVMIILQNNDTDGGEVLHEIEGLQVSPYADGGELPFRKFDLEFNFMEAGEELHLALGYNTDIYDSSTIERMGLHLEQLVAALVREPHKPLRQLDYLREEEKRQVLLSFNDTFTDYPRNKTIAELFAEQAGKTPERTALAFEGAAISYRELHEQSNRLAHYLKENNNIRSGDRVGILLDRSDRIIIALLGILKSGAAYVPIDVDYPAARKEFIVKDTGIKALITQSDYIFDLNYFDGGVFAMDLQLDTLETSAEMPETSITPDSAAYIMYTSGSTGNPKGVMIAHRSVVRLVKDTGFVSLTGEEVLLSTGAVSFDATTFEYWAMLLNGGTLVMSRKEVLLDSHKLREEIQSRKVDMMWFTAGWLHQLVDENIEVFEGLKTVLAGGDKLSPLHIQKLRDRYPQLRIINGYGPTENTTFSLTYDIETAGEDIPVGQPVSNSTAYILDAAHQPVPVGVVGEICVGGDGLALGYLNNPELTAEKFINVDLPLIGKTRLYKTGDLGRWNADGVVRFLGRRDAQIKIRGFRIELGEIENLLQSCPGIHSALVIAMESGEEKELVAYVVGEEKLNAADLASYLSGLLPSYMVPAHFIQLDELPLNSNGKVDRSKLPDPAGAGLLSGVEYIAPRNTIEEKLAAIWQEILGRESIGVKDNFFDLGGHSLRVTRLASLVHKEFDVKIELKDLFEVAVLEEQARLIARSAKTSFVTIQPLEEQEDYVLSSSQRRLWVLSQLGDSNVAYNMPGVYVIEGNLDRNAFEAAFASLIERHESLRTVFRDKGQGNVRQVIRPAKASGFSLNYLDLRSTADREAVVKSLVAEEHLRNFNLSEDPLLHASLYQVEEDRWILGYVMHHIISDGWSMNILVRELMQFYKAHAKGATADLQPLRIQYKDYAAWQQEQLSGENLQAHKEYWLQQFEGELPVLEFPSAKPRPALKTYNGAEINLALDAPLCKGLKALSQQGGGTLFMGLLATVNALLYRYTNAGDIIIGTPIAGRKHADLDGQIGFYVNTLALRSRFSGSDSFSNLLEEARQTTIGAYEHQVYPFDELVEALNIRRDVSRHPLFDVMISLQNNERSTDDVFQDLEEIRLGSYEGEIMVVSKFDLEFNFVEEGEELLFTLGYNSDIYAKESMEVLARHLQQLLSALILEPQKPIAQLDYLGEDEKQKILVDFNDTLVDFPKDKTLIQLFEERAAEDPEAIALVFGNTELTYGQLNEQSNQFAHYLKSAYAVQPEDRIAICLDRGPWMIVSALAVLKSGAAYVPVDTEYPQERIDHILQDSESKTLINEAELEKFRQVQEQFGKENLAPNISPSNLAYIIYTSGSTGKPKGVMVEHHSVVNLVLAQRKEFGITPDENILQFSNFAFDASVEQIFMALTSGARLTLIDKETQMSPKKLEELVETKGITHVDMVPGVLELMKVKKYASVKRIVAGGERCSVELAKNWSRHHAFYNAYGPTETTITAIEASCDPAQTRPTLPIGRPLSNGQVYILDELLNPQPIGAAGEIYIGGAGVARGYWNRPELTAEKFISNPFRAGERIYRTGDLGRWLEDGSIEFIGRKDEQVKIRGYRIELGEIENALQNHPSVTTCVVLSRTVRQAAVLVAYVTSHQELDFTELRTWLGRTLPHFMMPSHFVQLPALPLTPNGKVDRKALPDPEELDLSAGTTYKAPRTEIERALASVYEEVLKRQPIGIREDFFALGGDSIKSIQIVSRMKQRGYALAIQNILLHPTIEALSAHVKPVTREADQGIISGDVALSPIQHWFFEKNPPAPHHYNQSVLLFSKKPLEVEGIKTIFDKLVLHHDALRSVFRRTDSGWMQENKGREGKYGFEILTFEEETFAHHCDRIQSTINLEEGPLFKVALFQSNDGDHLLLVAHHLVIDGVSWRILFEDISTLYEQHTAGKELALPPKTDSFQYWGEKQMEFASGEKLAAEEAYWSDIESLSIEPLPQDNEVGSNTLKDTASLSGLLEEGLTERLLTKSYAAYRTEVNDVLLTALGQALQEEFGLSRVLLEMEGHGREDIGADVDVSRTVGWFTTSYPVVLDMSHKNDIIRQLIEVKETLHRVPNKGIGYGVLRYLAKKEYHLSPQISFNYLGDFGSGIGTEEGGQLFEFPGGYHGRQMSEDTPRTSLLELTGMIVGGQLRLSVSYSSSQYEEDTIQRLIASWQQHLERLVSELAAEENAHLTPVDLTYKELGIDEVQELEKELSLEDAYPLSPLQEGMYYHWLSAPEAYFEQTSYQLKGKLDLEKIERAYEMLVDRHAMLRTCFRQDFGKGLLQVVQHQVPSTFRYIDLSGGNNGSVEELKRKDKEAGFDLGSGSQMRLTVLGLGSGQYEFIWSSHHILMDGWCIGLLINDFYEIYHSLVQEREARLGKVYPFSNYISWLSSVNRQSSSRYWSNYLSGYDSLASVPRDRTVKDDAILHKELKFSLDATLRQSMKMLCEELGITENTFIQTLWGILLGRYNHTGDTVFGAVVSGRPPEVEGVEGMIGLFINTIPVRVRANAERTAKELLKEVQQASIESLPHHYTQLADIQSGSELGPNLFDHLVVFENYPVQQMVEDGIAAQSAADELSILSSATTEASNYDFAMIVSPGREIGILFSYNGLVYDEGTMKRLQRHFGRLVKNVLEEPSKTIGAITYLDEQEERQLVLAFNDTAAAYPEDKTIVQLFEEQVARTPVSTAIVSGKAKITYEELNEKANALARYLQYRHAVQPGELIAVCLERSAELVVSILAVLKCGGAYVPIDPSLPQERIDYMLEDSGSRLLIDRGALKNFYREENDHSIENVAVAGLSSSSLAYVIYTSGSTGKPKGVMVQHRALANLCFWHNSSFNVRAEDRSTLYAGVGFDASAWELFPYLIRGASLHVVPEEVRLDTRRLAGFYGDSGITIAFLPTQIGEQFIAEEEPSSLRCLLLGGDKLNAFTERKYAIVNNYGPTENTVVATSGAITRQAQNIPIGKPVSNTAVYIMDGQMNLQPTGIAGEICIGGKSLALGYWNRPELTAEKFVTVTLPLVGETRLYRTGDLGRWMEDGNIEFLGRRDAQVKIRGFRIELGEIEAALLGYEGITSTAVAARTTASGEKELAAYITGREELDVLSIKAYLASLLPAYMIPAHFMQLEELPLNSSGKVDRKRLPEPEGANGPATEYLAPRNATEEKLALIWQEVLGRERVGVKDNFFALGGHSLKATRLVSQVHKVMGQKLAIKELFAAPVLEDLAAAIVKSAAGSYEHIAPVAAQEAYELSPSQRRLWVLSQLEEASVAYNLPGVYAFNGTLDRQAFEKAFASLVERHEVLRTVFRENGQGDVMQYVLSPEASGFRLHHIDLRSEEGRELAVKDLVNKELSRSFDLSSGPLLSASLYRMEENRWVFSVVMHHIISDGWSMGILVKELLQLYNAYTNGEGNPLKPLHIQYKDFAAWQLRQLSGENLEAHKNYWLQQFGGELPVLELPGDRPRPAIKTYNGNELDLFLDAELSEKFVALCQQQGGTLFMGLMALLNTLFYRYTGQEDIIIGSPIAGRQHADLDEQIGFYVNTLALRSRFSGGQSFRELLEGAKQTTLDALEHQVYPFDELVDALNVQRDMSRSPLFDVMMGLQNQQSQQDTQGLGGIQVSGFGAAKNEVSKFDLIFNFNETGAGLQVTLEYNTDIYEEKRMKRMMRHLEQLLAAVTRSPQLPVRQLDYLDEQEQRQLTLGFNDTAVAYPENKTIVQLFEEQAAQTPGRTALVFEEATLTYKELNERANRFAHFLHARCQPGAEELVGLQLERSQEFVIALLGILKAGAAYLPLDMEFPQERIAALMEDSGSRVLVNGELVQEFLAEEEKYEDANPSSTLQPSSLAYVMYTSGSTGKPKGVMAEHRAVVRLVKNTNYVDLSGEEVILSAGAVSFDATTFEYWGALLNGGKLVMARREVLLDSSLLAQELRRCNVDTMFFTTGWVNQLIDEEIELFGGLKTLLTGGEKISIPHMQKLHTRYPKLNIVHCYGPTENTTFSLTYPITSIEEHIPIGSAISNSTAYILDAQHRLVSLGVAGEICVGGDGLARGYLGNPELTAEKFITVDLPFAGATRLYKSGDLGRWREDGNIEFIGRRDAQVKIRGFRIEPGEIEAALLGYGKIVTAVVIARVNASGEKELAAYVTGTEDLDVFAIRAYLGSVLPAYMIPVHFVQMEELPLTSSGKVDRKLLPEPESADGPAAEYVAPRNEIEEKLVLLWQEVLGRERIGVKDNFFELGGHSLKVTKLASRIKKDFEVNLGMRLLFSNPTIEAVAAEIEKTYWVNNEAVEIEEEDSERFTI